MTDSDKYRGYIASRPIRGQDVPHQVQNMVVREYCRRNDMQFLLSATEYSIPHCYMMLTELMNTLEECQGIVLYSQFVLPRGKSDRLALYSQVLQHGRELHAALENVSIKDPHDVTAFEDAIAVVYALPDAPLQGLYDKSGQATELEALKALVL